MPKPVGGYGHRAPYDTKLVRIPEPLESQIVELKSRYYGFLDGGGEPSKPVNWIKEGDTKQETKGESQELELIRDVLKRWENDLIGVNKKTNVRWDKAAKLIAELRQVIGED